MRHDLTLLALVAVLSACSDMALLPISAGTGPNPILPEPRRALIPTVNIAPAKGWPAGIAPQGAPGTRVVAFARNLEHPRWRRAGGRDQCAA